MNFTSLLYQKGESGDKMRRIISGRVKSIQSDQFACGGVESGFVGLKKFLMHNLKKMDEFCRWRR
ncbi:hypothetical protein K2173_014869 [Erythroxylum novogranatense]|uniref:Uncharacterized protein n=1 Tax=Erythroxylum novogranatense TaxID=1862640 RepID=A0AAV8TFU4_9ROSI|nr:hypothetical protein K2173_014869 [Erythroxylum novogranatense]